MSWRIIILSAQSERVSALAAMLGEDSPEMEILPVATIERALDLAREERGPGGLLVDGSALGDEGVDLARLIREQNFMPVLAVLEPHQEHLLYRVTVMGAQDCLLWGGFDGPELLRRLHLANLRLLRSLDNRQERLLYRSIVEDQTFLICRILPDGTLTFANQAYCRYFGIPPHKAVGLNVFKLLSAEECQPLQRFFATLTPEMPQGGSEHAFPGPNGETRWQKWTTRAIFDRQGRKQEFQCVGLDITERKLMEQTLQTVEANLRQLILNNADGMVVVDEAGNILFVNPAAERLLGQPAAALAGHPFQFRLHPGTRTELCLMRKGQDKVVIEMWVVRTKWQGQPAYLASLRDITELAELREELRALSLVDELTGLYNRRGFLTLAQQQIKTARRMKRPMLLFFMDLDDLKHINDRLGHREGDRALLSASQVLRSTFREADIVARMGGDEFVALAMAGETEQPQAVLQRLGENLDRFNHEHPGAYRLSLSVGTATYEPQAPRSLDELLREADARMYEHKRNRSMAQAQ